MAVRVAVIAALAAWALTATGCRDSGPPPQVVRKVLVTDHLSAVSPGYGVTTEDVRAAISAALSADNGFKFEPETAADSAWVADVTLRDLVSYPRTRGGKPGRVSRVALAVKLNRGGGADFDSFGGDGAAERYELLPPDNRKLPAPHRELLAEAAANALRKLRVLLTQQDKDTAGLVSDLAAEDADIRDAAVMVLAERRDKQALDALIAALRDTDERVVRHAVGALEQLGDPRAAGPIADATKLADPRDLLRTIDVVRKLGGPDARDFLFVIAAGHENAQVREQAQAALDALQTAPRTTAAATPGPAGKEGKP